MNTPTLAVRAKGLLRQLHNSATGPLLVAADVYAIGEAWDSFAGEVGKLSFAGWCRQTFGKGRSPRFFSLRHQAVLAMGSEIRERLHHDAAVWAHGRCPKDKLVAFTRALLQEYAVEGHPLSVQVACRVWFEFSGESIGKRPKVACSDCAVLRARLVACEKALVAAGLPIPDPDPDAGAHPATAKRTRKTRRRGTR